MDDIKHLFKENTKTLAVIGLVALLIVAGSVVRCSAIHTTQPEDPSTQEQIEQTEQTTQTNQQEEGETNQQAISELSELGVQAIESPGVLEAELNAMLEANTWAATNETATLNFEDNVFVERTLNKETKHPYAILAAKKATDTTGNLTTITAAIETDGGVYILETTTLVSDKSNSVSMTLTSPMFASAGYSRVEAAEEIEVQGINDEVIKAIGGKQDRLVEEISEWCALHYPSAHTAVFTGRIVTDQNKETVTLTFEIDSTNPRTIQAILYTEDMTFVIAGEGQVK